MKKVVLYNPKAVFYDMPLALIAIASNLDRDTYEPLIIDGRISKTPVEDILGQLEGAVCFGVTSLTGAPLKDAIEVSEKVKAAYPDIPIIWGGWHTSLFPTEPLKDLSCVDITVQGQGELTFSEIVKNLDLNEPLENIAGISFRNKSGEIIKNKPRVIEDMNILVQPDYSLIDVEAYFTKKGKRQFDFISSTGCHFRCAFCADPFVFNRKFTSLKPEIVVDHLAELQGRYHFDDLNFQDETFFTFRKDIVKMAELIIEKGLKFSWAATMRADQGSRMSEEEFVLMKKSGLRRLLIGVESGSQEMLDWLKKDIKMDQIWLCAERCKRLGIDVIFPFIVGFPDESDESLIKTKVMIKKLRKMSSGFDTPVFYFKPYPGSAITQDVVKKGYKLPETTMDWSDFDYIGSHGPWVSQEKYKEIENLKFYLKLAHKKLPVLARPVQSIAKFRLRKDQYGFPWEKAVFKKFYGAKKLS
ncbi:MAG: B12-binding domain-containing radical SAM protein [Flavobacteriales bacterium]|nr:B12-binding domain-containing radical SAM protein [Flavobacteriales bacterium]